MPFFILFAFLIFLESVSPGLGARALAGLLALIAVVATSLPAGAVAGLLLVLPAYLWGWNGAVDSAYQEDITRAAETRQRRGKRWWR